MMVSCLNQEKLLKRLEKPRWVERKGKRTMRRKEEKLEERVEFGWGSGWARAVAVAVARYARAAFSRSGLRMCTGRMAGCSEGCELRCRLLPPLLLLLLHCLALLAGAGRDPVTTSRSDVYEWERTRVMSRSSVSPRRAT